MYETEHPAFKKLQQIGKEITTKVRPKAVVVFSAHWQADAEDTIEVNTSETTDLIYESVQSMWKRRVKVDQYRVHSFYGFPADYYKGKFDK